MITCLVVGGRGDGKPQGFKQLFPYSCWGGAELGAGGGGELVRGCGPGSGA